MMMCRLTYIGLRGLTRFWDENCEHAVNLNFRFGLTNVNQNTFTIWDVNSNDETWKVIHMKKDHLNVNMDYLFLQRFVIIFVYFILFFISKI